MCHGRRSSLIYFDPKPGFDVEQSQDNWQPSASLNHLRLRAHIIQQVREFFIKRNVLEVDTPVLCQHSVTDPFIQSIPALFQPLGSHKEQRYYLQTSPEYAMKRLLAAGSGPIFQLCKSFRQGEVGRLHNPEFMMLEWYRPGYDHHQLMDEMDELLQLVLKTPQAKRISYGDLFEMFLGINPHTADLALLKQMAQENQIDTHADIDNINTWLELLFSQCIEPKMDIERPWFVYNFPTTQAALARIIPGNPPVAARFEVYFRGIELANGFHELADVNEQRARFEKNVLDRQTNQMTNMTIDEYFLAALASGLPDCAGVALGIDRLVLLAAKAAALNEVLSFDFSRI